MKHMKAIALAAMTAMALLAFGVGTASATTIEDAAGNHPTTIDASLVGTAVLSSGETVLDTCTGGTVEGHVTKTGSATETVTGHVLPADLTWSGCTKTTHTIEGGSLEIHHKAGTSSGTVTGAGFKVTVLTLGVTCTYGLSEGPYVHLGTLTGSDTTPILHIDTQVVRRTGSVFCPSTANWKATYHVTSPTGLTVTAG